MTTANCPLCGGELIGSEVDQGTCGHCGGRSLNPNRKRSQIALVTTDTQPTADFLDTLEAGYLAEGYERVWAVPVPASFEANARQTPWETRVYAEGNPYQPAGGPR